MTNIYVFDDTATTLVDIADNMDISVAELIDQLVSDHLDELLASGTTGKEE